MGTRPRSIRYINVFKPPTTELTWYGSLIDHPYLQPFVQGAAQKSLADAFVFAGAPIFGKGEWFIDSRYSLLPNVKLDDLPREAEDKITRYAVFPLPNDPDDVDRTTFPEDTSTRHGGLYYVGHQALKLLQAYGGQRRAGLCASLMVSNATVATSRRYKYPIVILHSDWDEPGAHRKLAKELLAMYRRWGPDIRMVRSFGSIREGHELILNSVRPDQSVLVIDSDFKPNGNHSLMYQPKGKEWQYVHLWHTDNRVNGAVYGHGSPKLLTRGYFDLSIPGEDMTMSCATEGFKVHSDVVGTHAFDTDLNKLARTTVREVYKLNKQARRGDAQAEALIRAWQTPKADLPERTQRVYKAAVEIGLTLELGKLPINDFNAVNNYVEKLCLASN